MSDRDNLLRGSCTCGSMRFEIRGPVVGINQCHCSKCRKETGAGSSTFIPVHASRFRWVSGSELVSDYDRCRVCGSLAPDHNPALELVNVPAGLLDDDAGVRVAHHAFVDDRAGWDVIPEDGAPRYEEHGMTLWRRDDFPRDDRSCRRPRSEGQDRSRLEFTLTQEALNDGEQDALAVGLRDLGGDATVWRVLDGMLHTLDVAWSIHRLWPRSDLVVLEDAGHGGVGFPETVTAGLDRFG